MKKINNRTMWLGTIAYLFFTAVSTKFAAADSFQDGLDAAKGNTSSSTVEELAPDIVNTALFIAGAAAVIMIIYGGYQFIFSAGNPEAASKGRQTIQWAVVGLVVCLAAYTIVNFVLTRIF